MVVKRDAGAFEERRKLALRLFREGMTQATVARRVGVTRQSVSRWIAAARKGGPGALRRRARPGRPTKLSAQQVRRLLKALERGSESEGYSTQLRTAERPHKLIVELFGVRFHVNHVPRLLRQCGWSYQRPTGRATERNEAAIASWLQDDWPRIKKKRVGSRPR
jgi:transposase